MSEPNKILSNLDSRFSLYRVHHQQQEARYLATYDQKLQKQRNETLQLQQHILNSTGGGSKSKSQKSSSGGIGSRSGTKRSHSSNCNVGQNAKMVSNGFDVPEKKPKVSNSIANVKTSLSPSHNLIAISPLPNDDSVDTKPLPVSSPITGAMSSQKQTSIKHEVSDLDDLFDIKEYSNTDSFSGSYDETDNSGPDVDPAFVRKYLDPFFNGLLESEFFLEPDPTKVNFNCESNRVYTNGSSTSPPVPIATSSPNINIPRMTQGISKEYYTTNDRPMPFPDNHRFRASQQYHQMGQRPNYSQVPQNSIQGYSNGMNLNSHHYSMPLSVEVPPNQLPAASKKLQQLAEQAQQKHSWTPNNITNGTTSPSHVPRPIETKMEQKMGPMTNTSVHMQHQYYRNEYWSQREPQPPPPPPPNQRQMNVMPNQINPQFIQENPCTSRVQMQATMQGSNQGHPHPNHVNVGSNHTASNHTNINHSGNNHISISNHPVPNHSSNTNHPTTNHNSVNHAGSQEYSQYWNQMAPNHYYNYESF